MVVQVSSFTGHTADKTGCHVSRGGLIAVNKVHQLDNFGELVDRLGLVDHPSILIRIIAGTQPQGL